MEGIPWSATEDDIYGFFDQVSECPFSTQIEELRAPKFQDSGRLKGYAHIQFLDAKTAKKALQLLDGQYLGERFITLSAAKPAGFSGGLSAKGAPGAAPKRPAGCSTLFVKNLPYEMTEDQLKAGFSRFGTVASARLARWNHTQRLKGFGYVQFEHGFSAEAAMKAFAEGLRDKRPLRVMERVVDLDYDTGAPKSSFRAEDGRYFGHTEEAKVGVVKRSINKVRHSGDKEAKDGEKKDKKDKKERSEKKEKKERDEPESKKRRVE
jgi:nucleolin